MAASFRRKNFKEEMALKISTVSAIFYGDREIDGPHDIQKPLFINFINGDTSFFVGRKEIIGSWYRWDQFVGTRQRCLVRVNSYQAGSCELAESEFLIERCVRGGYA